MLPLEAIKTGVRQDVLYFAENSLSLEDYFVCIYGSFSTSHFRQESDLDIVFATETPNELDFTRIQDFVIYEHEKYGLEIDQEVPYRNKLLVSYEDIKQAASLNVFNVNNDDVFAVPEITDDIEFLSSIDARKRLLLNALTTPHDFMCGNQEAYSSLKAECEKSMLRLAHGIGGIAIKSTDDLMNVLLSRNEDASSGRAYLGYKPEREEVIVHLRQLIARNTEYLSGILNPAILTDE